MRFLFAGCASSLGFIATTMLITSAASRARGIPSAADLLATADELQGKVVTLEGRFKTLRSRMSGLKVVVAGLAYNLTNASHSLAAADASALTLGRQVFEQSHDFADLKNATNKLEGLVLRMAPSVKDAKSDLGRNVSEMEQIVDKLAEDSPTARQIDRLEERIATYKLSLRNVVNRSIRYPLGNFTKETRRLLANMSKIVHGINDHKCCTPPCLNTWL